MLITFIDRSLAMLINNRLEVPVSYCSTIYQDDYRTCYRIIHACSTCVFPNLFMFIFADNATQRTKEVTTMKLRNVQLQQAQNAPYRSNGIAILRTRVIDFFTFVIVL